jgi:hypothetical protein
LNFEFRQWRNRLLSGREKTFARFRKSDSYLNMIYRNPVGRFSGFANHGCPPWSQSPAWEMAGAEVHTDRLRITEFGLSALMNLGNRKCKPMTRLDIELHSMRNKLRKTI